LHYDARKPRKTTAPSSLSHSASSWSKPSTRPKVTGYTTEEAIGQNPRILKSGRTPPELYEELWQTITAGGVWRGELLNKKKNGELYWELASIGAVKEGEKLTNFVAVKEDITARREMEEQLRQSQKMQVVGQPTGGTAYDFANPLAIVIGNA
jgi:PAS domain S-box-containing protein